MIEIEKKLAAIEAVLDSQAASIERSVEVQTSIQTLLIDGLKASAEIRERLLSHEEAIKRVHVRLDDDGSKIEAAFTHSRDVKDVTSKWINRGFGFYFCLACFAGAVQYLVTTRLDEYDKNKKEMIAQDVSLDKRLSFAEYEIKNLKQSLAAEPVYQPPQLPMSERGYTPKE
jgi:hypothetical protein